MTQFVEHYGLWVVFGVVFLEVAGLPFVPGETALIAAALLILPFFILAVLMKILPPWMDEKPERKLEAKAVSAD